MPEPKFKHLQQPNLSSQSFDRGSILIHAPYAAGKSHFGGDACLAESKNGRVAYLNVHGEDGQSSAVRPGLTAENLGYNPWYDITCYDAMGEFLDYAEKTPHRLIVLDSLPIFFDQVIAKRTGGNRPPESRGWGDSDWSDIHLWMANSMTRLRKVAPYLVVLSPSDLGRDTFKDSERGLDPNSKSATRIITPDLPGKLANGCIKWFTLVGYLKADYNKAEKVMRRNIHVAKSDRWLTRQQLPHEILEPIVVPQNEGGWNALMTAVQHSYQTHATP